MLKSLSDADRQRLVDVVAQSTREGICQVSPGELDAGWLKLEQALSDGKHRSVPIIRGHFRSYFAPWYVRGLAVVSMIVVVGIIADWVRTQRDLAAAPLAFVVEGASLGPAQAVEAHADAPAELVFSDHSRVRLAPKTKVAVLSMDTQGARVSLADGDLDVAVKQREQPSWRFEAGPFIVSVQGTSFHLGYEAERGRLAVEMREGVVEVAGPSPNRKLTLRGGESLELFAQEPPETSPSARAVARGQAPLEPPPIAPEPPAEKGRALSHRTHARILESPTEREGGEAWSKLIARGEFAAVVKDAEDRGLDRTLMGASSGELTALADAARYTRRYDVARMALLRVRDHFPGTHGSSDAAFFLGRLAEAEPSPQVALSWYETYLRESSDGAYAGEALGREVALFSKSNRARARVAARQYLERFPHGSQAELAKSLVQSVDE